MAFQLRRSDDEGVPAGAIKCPDDDTYVAVNDSEADSAFGLAIQDSDGDVEAWFPWGGEEIHKKGDNFSFLVRDPDYSYTWVLVKKYVKKKDLFTPLSVRNAEGEEIVPASFCGRLGKISISSLAGWTSFGGEELNRSPEEVHQAKILCARRKHQQCPVVYQPIREGSYPPADAIRAPYCRHKSFVVLSADFDPPQFGRASLAKYRDGLQAWIPYGGDEISKEDFLILRGNRRCFYWTKILEVHENPNRHEIVRYGAQSPAVMGGILGKAHISDLNGWVSDDGEERGVDQDEVLDGWVLCYRDECDD